MESGQLIKIGDCTCPEDIVTYNCIVNAPGLGGFTIWRGTAFDECPDVQNRVLLRHNSYQNGGAFGQCGDAIVGRSLQVEPNFVYISQLQINIAANPGLIGRTVECVYNPSGNTIIFINSTTIDIEGNYDAISHSLGYVRSCVQCAHGSIWNYYAESIALYLHCHSTDSRHAL